MLLFEPAFREGFGKVSGRFREGFPGRYVVDMTSASVSVKVRFRKGFGKFREGFREVFGKVSGRLWGGSEDVLSGRFREAFGKVSGRFWGSASVRACVRAKLCGHRCVNTQILES